MKKHNLIFSSLLTIIIAIVACDKNSTSDQQSNLYPEEPSNSYPADGATEVSSPVTLSWSCSDPNGAELSYDVYFGKYSEPEYYSSTMDPTVILETLDANTTYYWNIDAFNDEYSTYSPTWSFTTSTIDLNNLLDNKITFSGESTKVKYSDINFDETETIEFTNYNIEVAKPDRNSNMLIQFSTNSEITNLGIQFENSETVHILKDAVTKISSKKSTEGNEYIGDVPFGFPADICDQVAQTCHAIKIHIYAFSGELAGIKQALEYSLPLMCNSCDDPNCADLIENCEIFNTSKSYCIFDDEVMTSVYAQQFDVDDHFNTTRYTVYVYDSDHSEEKWVFSVKLGNENIESGTYNITPYGEHGSNKVTLGNLGVQPRLSYHAVSGTISVIEFNSENEPTWTFDVIMAPGSDWEQIVSEERLSFSGKIIPQ